MDSNWINIRRWTWHRWPLWVMIHSQMCKCVRSMRDYVPTIFRICPQNAKPNPWTPPAEKATYGLVAWLIMISLVFIAINWAIPHLSERHPWHSVRHWLKLMKKIIVFNASIPLKWSMLSTPCCQVIRTIPHRGIRIIRPRDIPMRRQAG